MRKCQFTCLGVDISKVKFDVCLLTMGKELWKSFPNDRDGFDSLSQWLKDKGIDQAHVCMESTGRYGEALAEYLHDQDHWVSVVNPQRIKGKAQSELLRSKADRLDASLTARFCLSERPSRWLPQPPELRELQEVERHLESLKSARRQELNRLEPGLKCQALIATIQAHTEFLDHQINELECWLKEHRKLHPKIDRHYKLITSVIGIGDTTAAVYLGEVGYSESFQSPRQLELFTGLAPCRYQSGTSVKRADRISKVSNPRLRKALYMPALSAIQHNPIIREFAERLSRLGKPSKVIICAVMRKLLRIIYGVLKSGQPFNPNYTRTLSIDLSTPVSIPLLLS